MAVTEVSDVRCVHSVVSVLPEYHQTVDSIIEDLVQRSGLHGFVQHRDSTPSCTPRLGVRASRRKIAVARWDGWLL